MRTSRKLALLERQMAGCNSYEEWREAALQHDELSGMRRWREVDQTRQYDYSQIRLRLDRLRSLRSRHDHQGLLFTLNEGIHGNMGGMGRSSIPSAMGVRSSVRQRKRKSPGRWRRTMACRMATSCAP